MKKFSYQSVIRKITFTSILLMIFYFIISLYLTETFYAQNNSLDQETIKVVTFSGAPPLDIILSDQPKATATLFLDDNTQIPLKVKLRVKNNGLKYTFTTYKGASPKFKMTMTTFGSPEEVQKYKIKFDGNKMNPSDVTITTGNITVTSPKSGDVWKIGTTQQITWTSSGFTGNVDVLIYKGGNSTGWGFFDKENTGSISWTITDDFAVGSDYTIKIVSVKDNSISGESGLFTISDDGDGDIGRIWVRVSHMGNATWTIIGIPTYYMTLRDESGYEVIIPVHGCITLGGSPYAYYYSAWKIDQASTTQPTQETICYNAGPYGEDCIPAWYPVDIPSGFIPVEYWAGCMVNEPYLPFDFL